MNKLWKKNGAIGLHPLVEKYTVGSDYLLDMELLPFDIEASKAHAKGLEKIEVILPEELEKMLGVLEILKKKFLAGKVEIKVEDEDCHTVIENYLIEELGDVGKKIHTGRSRNDQVLVAMRLWMKDKLLTVSDLAKKLEKKCWQLAKKHQFVPMPGYTHTQQAMLTSVGHYLANFAEALADDRQFLEAVLNQIDQNPLGSAAGFGVSFPLDRELTTKELGFGKVQNNSLYCQNSRGKFESLYLEGMVQVMMTLGKMAGDFLLWTSREFDFFAVAEELVTGSSIMPQKKNLDLLEIMRGNVAVVMANQMMVKDISKNLLSGYNRDFQLIKKPLFESVEIVLSSLEVMMIFLDGIEPKEETLKAAIKKDIFAADLANALVKNEGVSFRDAYGMAMDKLLGMEFDFEENLKTKISPGAAFNFIKDE